MTTQLMARLILSLMLLATIVSEIGFVWVGWTGEHLDNPAWHPHGRFHAAQFMAFSVAMSLVGLWLMWRRSREPQVAVRVVAALIMTNGAAQFFAFFVPDTSPSPELDNPNTFSLLGFDVHGNLFVSAVAIALSLLALLLTGGRAANGVQEDAGPDGKRSRRPSVDPGRDFRLGL